MHFSVIITLGLEILLCQHVISSRYSIFENQTSSVDKVDNVLGKFFTEFNEVYLKKNQPRQVAVIGASTTQLRQTQSLLESNPYTICSIPERCVYPENFNSGSLLIVFIDDLGVKTLKRKLNILSGCSRGECEFLFIFKGTIIKSNDISSFIKQAIRQGVMHFALAHLDKTAIKVYRSLLDENCSLQGELVVDWRLGSGLNEMKPLRLDIRDMKGCPFTVGSFKYMPKMVIKEEKNGSLTIAGGMDGMLVLLIAEKLNFTIDLKYPSTSSQVQSQKSALRKEVTSGRIAFGVGRLRPSNKSVMSTSFDEECVTWAVPRIIGITENLIWTEFDWKIWALIISVFIVSCMIEYTNRVISSSRNDRQDVGFVKIILDMVSINLGNPVMNVPVSLGGKLMFISLLYYAIITTTAYKTSLASILATIKSSSSVTNANGIIEANFDVGGSLYYYNVLKDQTNASKLASELFKRYKIYNNYSESLHRVEYDQDFALFARRSTLEYEKQMTVKAHKLIKFDIVNGCALTYQAAIIFRKGSLLFSPINKLISYLSGSGILQYWDQENYLDDKTLEQKNADRFSSLYARQKFKKIFIIYVGCIALCLTVFFIELLTARFKPKRRQRIVRFVHN